MSREIYVFADWEVFEKPTLIGVLCADVVKAKEHFSFAYDDVWLQSEFAQQIDPELHLYAGSQHSQEQQNFRIFLDSCPDRWGRLLMKRRELVIARQEGRKPHVLNESDYLLGVHDMYRMGALRFKQDLDGDFLDNNEQLATPPITSLREIEHWARWLGVRLYFGCTIGPKVLLGFVPQPFFDFPTVFRHQSRKLGNERLNKTINYSG